MSFKVESKASFLHIKFGEDTFTEAHVDELQTLMQKHASAHVLLNLTIVEEFEDTDALQDFQVERLDENFSFIVIVRESLMNLFDEDLPVVPTYQEAEDFFEMDEIQRKLMEE
jgi:hypothetical protein